ncbi:MAG: sigma 54-interacting transcriptional regulator [Myxococcales bacterium]|nr:sigma 54-interacting transcriptional regulator [Myxococcales bacterium]
MHTRSSSKNEPTSSVELWEGAATRESAAERAGLVLLYAECFREMPASVAFDRTVTLIGREDGAATVVIPQRAVSRLHASVQATESGYRVKDLGSRNGIVVAGRRVREAVLEDGDELRVGDALFKFVAREASAYAPYSIDGGVAVGAVRTSIPGAVGGLAMARLSLTIERIAPGDLQVLVQGETGTGKELVARALHAQSGRRGPMLALNCASIPASLVESELFGHVKGAFSGAARDHVGVIRSADKGTLLLDEIGDMPLEAQAKLLRVLETREVVPVGAVSGYPVDVRIVSATHRNVRELVARGAFRADLFARLDGYTLELPPLRERKEDLFVLVKHWLSQCGAPDRAVSFGFMLALSHYAWPFNVRELASAVKRALTMAEPGTPLEAQHLPEAILDNMKTYGREDDDAPASAPPVAPRSGSEPERGPTRTRTARPTPADLVTLLQRFEGNVSAVARALGKDRALVNRWIRADGVDPESFRRVVE